MIGLTFATAKMTLYDKISLSHYSRLLILTSLSDHRRPANRTTCSRFNL